MNSKVSEINAAIKNAENILIIGHVNPDGDSVASAAALRLFIRREFNKTSTVAMQTKVPEIYCFLPESESFLTAAEVLDAGVYYDTVIAVDCASKDRLADLISVFDKAKVTINIDHHKSNPYFAQYNYVKGESSSAGETVSDYAKESGFELNKDIANCLYVAVLTDTGGFRFENTSAATFRTVANFLEYGISPSLLYRCCYESKPKEMVKLNACVVSKAEFLYNGKFAYTIITLDDLKNNNALAEYTDGIVEILRQVNSVDIAAVLKETEQGYTKVSLRSKVSDVCRIAGIFGGGGHTFAAGCTIKKPYKVAENKIKEIIEKELNRENV